MHGGALSFTIAGAGNFFCAACDSLPPGFKLCLVFGATDAADESWGILQQGVLLHAKHKLES